MQSIRCGQCGALLAKIEDDARVGVQIKCRRCGTLNHYRTQSPEPERPGASPPGDAHGNEEGTEGPAS